MPVVDELVTILGLEEDGQNAGVARKFTGLLDGIQKKALALAAAVTATAGAIGYFVRDAVAQADEIQKLSESTGIAAETFQEWGYAAVKMGADARSVQNDIAALNKSMSSPIPGQFNMNLAMLGVHGKNAAEVLEQLSDKFQGMTAQRASQWGSMIGISDDTVRLLREGRATINDLRNEARTMGVVISDEDIARASEFSRTLKALGYTFNSLRQQIFIGAVPALDRFVGKVRDFLALNMGRIKDRFADFISGFTAALEQVWKDLEPIRNAFASVTRVISDFLGTGDAAETWGHLLVGAIEGALILLSPLIAKAALVGAAFTALSFVVEDLFAYFSGADKITLTEKLVDKFRTAFPELAALIDGMGEKIAEVWDYLSSPEGMKQISDAWDGISDIISSAVDIMLIPLKILSGVIGAIAKAVGGVDVEFGDWGTTLKDIGATVRKVTDWITDLADSVAELFASGVGRFVTGAIDFVSGAADTVRSGYDWLFGSDGKDAEGNGTMKGMEDFVRQLADMADRGGSFGLTEAGGMPGSLSRGMMMTVPAPAYSYYGNNSQTLNFYMKSTDPQVLTNNIRQELNNGLLIPTKAPGDFSAGVQ